MVDMTTFLGRPVPTPEQVISVINGDLVFARAVGLGLAAMDLPVDTIAQVDQYGVEASRNHVFAALQDSAMVNVKQWAGDEGFVFDGGTMVAFVGAAIREAWMGDLMPDLDR